MIARDIMKFQSSNFKFQMSAAGLGLAVAITVFGAVPGFQAPDAHNFTAYYALALLGVLLLPVPGSAKLFAGICAASCVWLQVMIANVEPRTLSPLFLRLYLSANADFQFVLLFLGLYAIILYVRPEMDTWLNFLCWVALVEVVRISLQRLGWDPVYVPVNNAGTIAIGAGSMGNIGWSGMVLAMCVPAFCRKRLFWGLLPVALALVALKSLTPVIAAAGAAGFIALCHKRRVWAWFGVLAAILAPVLYVTLWDPGDSARFANWARGWDLCMGRESWLLGYGLGSWIFLFPEPATSFHRAHCEPLQVFFELGMLGVFTLLLYGRFLILRFVRSVNPARSNLKSQISNLKSQSSVLAASGMTAVILCALGNFPYHLAGTAVIAVGWMAMFDLQTRCKNGL